MKTSAKSILITVVSVTVFLLHSCEKNNNENLSIKDFEAYGYYPLQVDNYWKYSDGRTKMVDAVKTIDGKEYFRIITTTKDFTTGNLYDTIYVRKSGDGSRIYRLDNKNEVLAYDFTAQINNKWTTYKTSTDSSFTSLTSKNDSLFINSQLFPGCLRFASGTYNTLIIDAGSSSWILPGIGIAKQVAFGLNSMIEEAQIDGNKIKF